MGFRLDPKLVADVQARTDNVTAAVEQGLRLWLARDKRKKAAKPEPLPCPDTAPWEPPAGNET